MKGRSNKKWQFLIVTVLFLACDNLFSPDEYKPSGNPFSLNSGIELLGIMSSDTLYSPSGAFTLELRVKASSEKMDTLPAGLFFLSSDKGKKDMIIVKDFPIVASVSERIYVLPVFGVQRKREIPAETDYLFGPITDDPDLKPMVDILKRKRIEGRNVSLVQSAIYRITDGEELTQGLLDTLNNLPDE
ncbi:MAG: hypothetical protein ABIK81_02445 [candidate division WOR-3 bacterium]